MIEVGQHPDAPGAVIFHSTESGRFMPAGKSELVGFLNAVKRGDYDGLPWLGATDAVERAEGDASS